MAFPTFTVEAIAASGPVEVTLTAINPEVALLRGKERLTEAHGKVRKATVRYAASANKMTQSDFDDPNGEPEV